VFIVWGTYIKFHGMYVISEMDLFLACDNKRISEECKGMETLFQTRALLLK